MNKVKFSSVELTFLITNVIIFKLFSLYPTIIEEFAATGLWMACIIATITVLVIFAVINVLNKPFRSMGFDEVVVKAFGRFGAMVFAVMVLFYYGAQMSFYLKYTVESLKVTSFFQSPTFWLALFFVIPAVYAVFKGIRGIVRLTSIILPIMIVADIILCLGAGSKFQSTNLFPIFGNGIGDTVMMGLRNTAYFGDIFLLFLMAPYAEKPEKLGKVGLASLFLSGAVMIMILTSYQLVASYPTTVFYANPLELMQNISQYDINFLRIGVSFMIFWVISFILYMATVITLLDDFLKRLTGRNSRKAFTILFGIIVLVLAVFMPSVLTKPELMNVILNTTLIVLFGLPVAGSAMARIRGHR